MLDYYLELGIRHWYMMITISWEILSDINNNNNGNF